MTKLSSPKSILADSCQWGQIFCVCSSVIISCFVKEAKIAASRKSVIFSEETKARMSTSHLGERNGRFNKGIPVYLYEVLPSGFELTFLDRCNSFLKKVVQLFLIEQEPQRC